MEKTKVCDLINNAIDEVRRCRFMVDGAAPKRNVKARLNATEHMLMKALRLMGGIKMKMNDEQRVHRVKANIRGKEMYLGEDGAFYPNGDKDIIYFTRYQATSVVLCLNRITKTADFSRE